MEIHKKLTKFIVPLLLLTLMVVPFSYQGVNTYHLSKVHPALVQVMKNNPDRVVNVIVGKEPGSTGVEDKAIALGGNITSTWDFINAFSVEIKADKIPSLAAVPGVFLVNNVTESVMAVKPEPSSDGHTTTLLNAYNYAVDVPRVWNKGYTGKGITIAVVDSGVVEEGGDDFGGRVLQSVKFNSTTTMSADKYGHGTHVAGIIGGNGVNSSGKYIGIAPDTNLINVKFSDDTGSANELDLINALQWVYDNREAYNIRVVNLSSNVNAVQSYRESAVCAAVEQLWNAGVVVVVSAGNNGNTENTISYAPANDPYVITVGAVDDNGTSDLDDDFMKSWSSYGITADGYSKPDVVAPGAHIISFMPGGELRKVAPENIVDTQYFKMGGTSMSAAVVSGIAALILDAHPGWTPDQVKWVLMNTTRDYNGQPLGTPGMATAGKAVFYRGTPKSANQGLELSPFLDPESATISYSNMSWSNMSWSNMSWSNSLDF